MERTVTPAYSGQLWLAKPFTVAQQLFSFLSSLARITVNLLYIYIVLYLLELHDFFNYLFCTLAVLFSFLFSIFILSPRFALFLYTLRIVAVVVAAQQLHGVLQIYESQVINNGNVIRAASLVSPKSRYLSEPCASVRVAAVSMCLPGQPLNALRLFVLLL